LLGLGGDMGAKKIVMTARRQGDVGDVWLSDRGAVFDVDTVGDLRTAQDFWIGKRN